MNYKKEYPYNYGFLSAAAKQTVKELEMLISQSKGQNKQSLKNIHSSLSQSLNICENNLNQQNDKS